MSLTLSSSQKGFKVDGCLKNRTHDSATPLSPPRKLTGTTILQDAEEATVAGGAAQETAEDTLVANQTAESVAEAEGAQDTAEETLDQVEDTGNEALDTVEETGERVSEGAGETEERACCACQWRVPASTTIIAAGTYRDRENR